MNKIKTTLFAALLTVSAGVFAGNNGKVEADSIVALKHYKFFDNTYVGLYVGDFVTLGENMRPREFFRPGAQRLGGGLTIGKNFSPALGVRMGGYISGLVGVPNREVVTKSRAGGYDGWGFYGYKQVSGYVDVVPNLTNIILPYRENRRLNVMGYFGLGFLHRFDMNFDELHEMDKTIGNNGSLGSEGWESVVSDKNRTFFAARAGLGLSYMLTKELDIDLDVMVHATDDKLDGFRYDDKYDGYISAMLGVKYHFRDHYGDHRFKYRTITDADELNNLNLQINKARQDLADARNQRQNMLKQQRVLDMTVQFPIDKFYITEIQERNVEAVAKYIKANPDLDVVICGFADVETAYPSYNMRLSKRRVTSVFRMLVDKYGVDPNHLSIDYKGDTVQPYDRKNEWNRVVVFVLQPHEEIITN